MLLCCAPQVQVTPLSLTIARSLPLQRHLLLHFLRIRARHPNRSAVKSGVGIIKRLRAPLPLPTSFPRYCNCSCRGTRHASMPDRCHFTKVRHSIFLTPPRCILSTLPCAFDRSSRTKRIITRPKERSYNANPSSLPAWQTKSRVRRAGRYPGRVIITNGQNTVANWLIPWDKWHKKAQSLAKIPERIAQSSEEPRGR